ncbi:sensor histidine kinase [Chitinophaga tropicalis]|nr:histidine kinase [Chitinophaga tropicalis]
MITINHFLIEHFYEYNFGAYRIFKARRYTSVFREIIANTNILGVIVFSSTSIKLLQRWQKDTVRINELEKKSLQIELRELKNQINPHFLFNMLNNANVLVLKDPEKASVVLMKLSDFLHHQLYENNNKLVSLQSEITFLNDFLELEKIRRDDFSFTITNKNPGKPGDLLLPPSLFTTFVENAVKHSADPDDVPSRVDLSFTRDNKSIFFTCINTKPGDPSSKTTGGGLGLTNITRRLDLLYGKHYTLKINETDSLYKVILHLPL